MKKGLRILSLLLAAALICSAALSAGVMSVLAAEDPLVLSDCDSLTGWTKEGGGNALTVDTVNDYNSDGAIRCNINFGKFGVSYAPAAAVDVSNYKYIEWDVRMVATANNGLEGTLWEQIKEQYGTTGNNKLFMRLISEEGNRVYFLSRLQTTVLNTDWVHFRAEISNFNTENGTFDPSKLTGFFFNTVDSNYVNTVSNGVIAIDNLNVTGYESSEILPTMITDCETADGWTYGGNATINISSAGKTDKAINVFAGYGSLRELTYTPAAPLDLSAYTAIKWDMTALAETVITDQWEAIANSYTDSIGVKLSDGTNTVTYSLMDLQINKVDASWWNFAVKLDGTKLNLANITSFSVFTNINSPVDNTLAGTYFKIDNLQAAAATVTPNGYDYAEIKDMVIEDAESKIGWSYYDDAEHANMSVNTNGYVGSAIQVFGGYCKIGPTKYTFEDSINISRHGKLSWNVRFLNGTANPDLWSTVSEAYAEHIKATIADANGKSFAYSLSDIKVEATSKEGWYTLTVDLKKASELDLTALKSFTFQLTDGSFVDDSLINCNMRIDNLTVKPTDPVVLGDTNGDGDVDIKDVVRFKRFLANEAVEFNTEAADLDGNGDADTDDLVILRKVLLGVEDAIPEYALLSTAGWSETVKP